MIFSDLDNSRFAIRARPIGANALALGKSFVDRWQSLRYIEIAGTPGRDRPHGRRHHHPGPPPAVTQNTLTHPESLTRNECSFLKYFL